VIGNYKGFKNHQLRLGTSYRFGEVYKVSYNANYGINPHTNQPIPPTEELTDLSGTSATFLPTLNRHSWSLFIQDIWTWNERWEATYGGRYDNYSDFGSTFNPRFALVWKTTPEFTTKFLYGKAFRAPSFQELHQANNPIALGNINLKPEEIQTYEIAFDYRPSKKWHIGLNAFVYDLTNKIIFVSDAQKANYFAKNAGSQQGKGFVIEGGWQLAKLFVLAGSYAFQRATDQDDHKVANGSPKQDIHLRGDWKFLANWHLNTQLSWINGRERAFNDPRPAIDDYVNVDLALHYKKSKSPWEVTLAVRNLLNSDIREPTPGPDETGMIKIPYDLPMAGINYFLEFRYHLNP
jgi:iron complex outermembrane receptor protein